MYVFALYLSAILFGGMAVVKDNSTTKKISWFVFIAIILILMFRFSIGSDINTYMYIFERVSNPIQDAFLYHSQRNVLFNTWMWICKSLFGSYQNFTLLTNMLVLSLCSITIKKYSKNILFSLAIFIGTGILEVYYSSGIRQMIAMAIFMFSYYQYLKVGRTKAYLIACVIASMFHEIALISLFLPILLKYTSQIRKNEFKSLSSILLVSCICFFCMTFVMPAVASAIGYDSVLTHVLIYFTETTFSIAGLGLRIVLFGIVFSIYKMIEKDKIDDFTYFQIITCFISMCLYICFANFSLMARVSDFIEIIMIILIPNLIFLLSSNLKKVISLIAVFGLNGFLLFSDLKFKFDAMNKYDKMNFIEYPYFTIWDDKNIEYYTSKILEQ